MSNNNTQGLISSYLLDGKGGGKSLSWDDIYKDTSASGVTWLHLDYTHPKSQDWLKNKSGLDPIIIEALQAEETRPRGVLMQDGLLVTLRSVNMNPGAEPEDMVSIRVWIDKNRIISTRHRRLLFMDDIRESIELGLGPKMPGEFLVHLADRLSERMAYVIDNVDETVDKLEEEVLTAESYQLRAKIANVRRETIELRRYLAPQREAMSRLYNERVEWLTDVDRMHLRETADRTMRYIEDLDSARDRATVTHEELLSRLSEQMDRRMYVLSIVAAVFLPLGFLTGLLGINVGGIPGAEDKNAFLEFIIILGVVVVFQITLFKWKKWM
ncbi:zinc transporter ZntB [Sulfuriflexus mobilis]|uniref:zinc transporter ZntB n=1 Tax=Sulfuriflexus mobilis TaxID=1811807 RepID=UPI000F843968|nr:zinc transporter ZntB [Sulfuriflexus mobilis]